MESMPPDAQPVLRVTSGEATPEELAAVLVALAVRRRATVHGAAVDPASTPSSALTSTSDAVSSWADPAWGHRRAPETPQPSPSAWRTSFRPG